MNTTLKWIITVVAAISISVAGTACYLTVNSGKRRLIVSTTTSLYDTGLLELLEKNFEEKYPIDVSFISAGTGRAIQLAKRGDADLILVHAPEKEKTFLNEGYGLFRKIIAYNFFVIIGPPDDPAKIKGLNITEALANIVSAGRKGQIIWVSRGDESGTHIKEIKLWSMAGFEWSQLKNEDWFTESGTGMGKTLLIANERNAYTLSDIGTYLRYREEGLISLKILVDKRKELLNVYSVIAVNPDRVPTVNFGDALLFIKFLISNETQTLIGEFKKDIYGESLFYPAVSLLKEKKESLIAQWIMEAAFINGTECPSRYWDIFHYGDDDAECGK